MLIVVEKYKKEYNKENIQKVKPVVAKKDSQ